MSTEMGGFPRNTGSLLSSVTATSTQTSVRISIPPMSLGETVFIEMFFTAASAGNNINVNINDDTTAANYETQWQQAAATGVSAGRANGGLISSSDNAPSYGSGYLSIGLDGSVSWTTRTMGRGGTTPYGYDMWGFYLVSSSFISSFTFTSSGANGIGANSQIKIYSVR